MTSTIHDATIVNRRGKDKTTNLEIKKPYTVAQYNKFYEGQRLDRPVPQLLLSSKENCKMVEKGGIVSAKLCTLECIFCVQTPNTNKKVK